MTAHPAITNLLENQQQLDADGCMVGVSRQALEETLDVMGDLLGALIQLEFWVTNDSDCRTAAQRQSGRLALINARGAIARAKGKSSCASS